MEVFFMEKKKRSELLSLRGRSTAIVALAFAFATVSAGCGKSQEVKEAEKYYQEELGMDKESAEELAADWYDNENAARQEAEEEKTEELEEETEEEIVQFELDPRVKDADPGAGVMQFDDMVFHFDGTMTVKEAVDEIMSSSLAGELDYTYNEEREISPGSPAGEIVFNRNGNGFFKLYYYNDTDQDCGVNDCIVGCIVPLTNTNGEKGFDYWLPTGVCITDDTMTRDDLAEQLKNAGYMEVEARYGGGVDSENFFSKSCYTIINEVLPVMGAMTDAYDLELVYVSGEPVNNHYNYLNIYIWYDENETLQYSYSFWGGQSAPIEQLKSPNEG